MSETFVAQRYHLGHRAYVDSKNVKLPTQGRFPECLGDPSKPTKDGSTPFLSLPTEMRLQIYGYLTHNDDDPIEAFMQSFDLPASSGQSTTYAYLYRSPGRVTKPHAISKEVIALFHVCRKMRQELVDVCFSDRTFVLEASLYRRDAGGLFVIPSNIGPAAWIKKLVLLTTIEARGFVKGIADLRPLQQMTNLKELYLGLHITNTGGKSDINPLQRQDSILRAIVECVPKATKIHFAYPSLFSFRDLNALEFHPGSTSKNPLTTPAVADMIDQLAAFAPRRGTLSGSLVNHSLCEYRACQEGLGCVNSQCEVVIHETQRSRVREISNKEFEKIKREQELKDKLNDLEFGEAPNPNSADVKKCVHGYTRCHTCEKGLVQKLKSWSGRIYRHRT